MRRADDGLALRLAELDPATQAAVLRLDPIATARSTPSSRRSRTAASALTLEQLEQLERDGEARAGG